VKSYCCVDSRVFFGEFYTLQTRFSVAGDTYQEIISIPKKILQNSVWRFFKGDIGVCMGIKKHNYSQVPELVRK